MVKKFEEFPIRNIAIVLLVLLLNGCAASGITLNSMYLKQNYLQLIQYAGQYENLDDYGVLKVCQSLVRVELFDEFYACFAELKSRAKRQGGALNGQINEPFTPSLTDAVFDTMLAEVESNLGNYEKAAEHAERALDILAREPYSVHTIVDVAGTDYEAIRVLLTTYPALHDKARTLSTIQRAKDLSRYRYRGETGFRLIIDLKITIMLTEAYYSIGEYNEAIAASRAAIEGLNSFGVLQKGLFSALTVVDTAMTGARTLDGKLQKFSDSVFANKVLPMIIKASSELELGNYAAAKEGFDQVLASKFITGIPRLYYPLLHDRGRVAEALGNDVEATRYYRESIKVIETSRSSIADDAKKISYVGNKQDVYQSLVNILFKQQRIDEAFEVAEDAKARALVDLLAGKSESQQTVLDTSGISAASQLDALEARIQAKSLEQRATSRSADLDAYAAAAETLQNEAPEYASLVTVDSAELSEIQQYLEGDELLLEYYGSATELMIFAVTKDSIRAVTVDAPQLTKLVQDFRDSIYEIDGDDYEYYGEQLYELLIAPVSEHVRNASGLSIVPHGVLHYVPFDALYSGQEYLIDIKPMRVLPSASVMAYLKKSVQDNAAMLILGNPDLNDRSMDLAGAEREAKTLAAKATDATLLLRSAATETAVKRSALGNRFVHFASHGVFDDETPLNSRLLLAPDGVNDGQLTVAELYGLKLNADLVTLSACETALGKVANGDDVVGFSRGFLYAGANSIVSSLWEVDDIATYELMLEFYANLKTMSKREALTQAQLTTKENYEHPFYWAAFQLTGAQ